MDLLRGLHTSPWIVALARGAVGALIAFLILWLGDSTNLVNAPAIVQQIAPLLVFALRMLEGTADQADPAKPS